MFSKLQKNKQLFVVHLYNDYSGSPRVLREIFDCNLLPSKDIYLFTSKHSGFLSDVNCNVVNIFYARAGSRFLQLLYFLLSQISLFFVMSAHLICNRIRGRETVVLINTMLPFGAGFAGSFFASEVVYYIHESHIRPILLKKILRSVVEYSADFVIFVSHYLQENEIFRKPVQSVIYNGLRSDFSDGEPIDQENKYANKKILFAASLKEYKGTLQLITLAEQLPEFNFVAAFNCTEQELTLFCSINRLPKNMVALSRPSNLKYLFRESYLVVNLSLPDEWVETFGLSLLEGMALGSPVVAPPVGGPKEFVNSDNGLVSDSRDTQAITTYIRDIDRSFYKWKYFSDQAIETAKKFTPEQYRMNIKAFFVEHNLT